MNAEAQSQPVPEPLDYEAILEEYRKRQMLEHLIGPAVSIVLHIVIIVLCAFLLVESPPPQTQEVEVNIEELKVKELEPQAREELQQLEESVEDVVPTVEKPEVPSETADVAATEDFSDELAQTDDDMDLSNVLDIKPSQTRLKLSALYGGRTNAGRRTSLKRYGGSVAGETALLKALRWLKAHQNADGSWSKTEKLAMTGLGLLAFLGHGETPLSKEFGLTVQKAMKYLADAVMAVPETSKKSTRFAYQNAIGTYALSEGYGLTKIPFLKPAMEKGLRFIVEGQQDRGGWDYGYRKGERWDLSVSGWNIQALKAGYVAGADVPGLAEAIEKAVKFLKKTAWNNGRFYYSNKSAGSLAMQGTGALCLQLLGEGRCSQVRDSIKYIFGTLPSVVWDPKKYGGVGHGGPLYAWYYETQVMFHAGHSYWRKWNKQFTRVLIQSQKMDGHWTTPWTAEQRKTHNWEFDPYYSTSLCCLMLEVYYRYLPTYHLPKSIAKGP